MERLQFDRLRGDDLLLGNEDRMANVLPDNPDSIRADIEGMGLVVNGGLVFHSDYSRGWACKRFLSNVGGCQEDPVVFMTLQWHFDERPRKR